MTFEDLGLSRELLQAITDAGYTQPTPIQEKAIPYVLMNRDVLGCAQTGTGKTASFTLPMIDILANGRGRARMPRSLILEPTRELAAQVADSFERYGKYHKLSKALLVGGSSIGDQEKALERGVDVLIATPGRLIDLFERGKVLLADVRILVIDESDRMLDMGFIPDVERIVSLLPKIRQTLFFSATMPAEIRRLADKFLLNPKEIAVTPPASPAESVSQILVRVPGHDKRKALRALLDGRDVASGLIFCNRKREVSMLARALKQGGYSVAELHGDMAQPVRTETLARFRAGEVTLLVCSDVAARGLDIPRVSHVFNYDVPHHPEDYVHRIGRTGRAGRPGEACTLATAADGKALAGIHAMLGRTIPAAEPSGVRSLAVEEVEGTVEGKDGRRRGRRGRRPGGRQRATATSQPSGNASPAGEQGEQPAEAERSAAADEAKAKPKAEHSARDERPARRRGRHKEARPGPGTNSSKPFGEHTPAFLLRRVPASAEA